MLNNIVSLYAIENKWGIDRHTLRKGTDLENNLKFINNKDNKFIMYRNGGVIKNFSDNQKKMI